METVLFSADGFYYLIIAALVLFFITAGGVIAILWIAMPFSVFGTKGLIKKMLEEQEKTNRLLTAILEEARESGQLPEKGVVISEGMEKAEDAHTEPER